MGKTTTCVNLAASLAAMKKRVLLVDLDPQGNATMGSGIDKYNVERSIYDVLVHRAPVAQVIQSPRTPSGEEVLEVPVDPALLDAGDHNGATFYQHQRFLAVLQSGAPVEVSLADGAKAVAMGLAAQRSAETGEAVRL